MSNYITEYLNYKYGADSIKHNKNREGEKMFKIGENVRVIKDNTGKYLGKIGTVISVANSAGIVSVIFDDEPLPKVFNELFLAYPHEKVQHNKSNSTKCTLSVDKIIYSGPKTIVFWTDGTKTIVGCSKNDEYDPYAGFCAALAKRVYGNSTKVRKMIDKFVPVETVEES